MTTLAKELSEKQEELDDEICNVYSGRERIKREMKDPDRNVYEPLEELPHFKLLPRLISETLLKSLKNDEGMWNDDNSMVYIEMHSQLVIRYRFEEFEYNEKEGPSNYWSPCNSEYEKIEDIYLDAGLDVTRKTIYRNLNNMDLADINKELRQSGFELLVLSAYYNYIEKFKLNAHAILRVI